MASDAALEPWEKALKRRLTDFRLRNSPELPDTRHPAVAMDAVLRREP